MDNDTILSLILDIGISDIQYLFSGMDSSLLQEAIDEIHNEEMKMSAENLWFECIHFAAERVFGTQSDFIDSSFNCQDSSITIKRDYLQYIENFEEKKDEFEKLINNTLEIWEV